MAHHVGSKVLQAAVSSGKTSNGVVRRPSDSITKWAVGISRELFVLESRNFTRHPMPTVFKATRICRHQLRRSAFMEIWENVHNATSYCIGSNDVALHVACPTDWWASCWTRRLTLMWSPTSLSFVTKWGSRIFWERFDLESSNSTGTCLQTFPIFAPDMTSLTTSGRKL